MGSFGQSVERGKLGLFCFFDDVVGGEKQACGLHDDGRRTHVVVLVDDLVLEADRTGKVFGDRDLGEAVLKKDDRSDLGLCDRGDLNVAAELIVGDEVEDLGARRGGEGVIDGQKASHDDFRLQVVAFILLVVSIWNRRWRRSNGRVGFVGARDWVIVDERDAQGGRCG